MTRLMPTRNALCGRGRFIAGKPATGNPSILHTLSASSLQHQSRSVGIALHTRSLHVAAASQTASLRTTATLQEPHSTSANKASVADAGRPASAPMPPPAPKPALTARSRDPRRLAAFAGILAAAGAFSYKWLSVQAALPPLEKVAGPLAAAAALMLAGVPAGLLLAKAALGDNFHFEIHRGRLYVCTGVPSSGPQLSPGAVAVHPTGDVRGNGAFAMTHIPAGTHIADYSGDRLDQAAFRKRYPDGVGDYAMAIDDEWVIDAASIAPYTAAFHAVHMNHSRTRANVGRYYSRREGRVSFFATRDIHPGEELLYDYGRAYWYGREHLELP